MASGKFLCLCNYMVVIAVMASCTDRLKLSKLKRVLAIFMYFSECSRIHASGLCEYSEMYCSMVSIRQSGRLIASSSSYPHSLLTIGMTPADITVNTLPASHSEHDGIITYAHFSVTSLNA